jgi:hypothetical protein
MPVIKIGERLIGDGYPTYVIAEIGVNHNGILDLAIELIDVAVRAGADAVKLQKRNLDSLYAKKYLDNANAGEKTLRYLLPILQQVELPDSAYYKINEYCQQKGITFLCSAFDVESADFLNRLGVPTKVERGGRVFPASDRAADVVEALESWIRKLGVDIRTGIRVQDLVVEDGRIQGVKVFTGVIPADAVVLATGGITYPRTGSTGDGYEMAAHVGHTVITPTQSLSALQTSEPWVSDLQGLSLRNVSATLYSGGKKLKKEFGEKSKLFLISMGVKSAEEAEACLQAMEF